MGKFWPRYKRISYVFVFPQTNINAGRGNNDLLFTCIKKKQYITILLFRLFGKLNWRFRRACHSPRLPAHLLFPRVARRDKEQSRRL